MKDIFQNALIATFIEIVLVICYFLAKHFSIGADLIQGLYYSIIGIAIFITLDTIAAVVSNYSLKKYENKHRQTDN